MKKNKKTYFFVLIFLILFISGYFLFEFFIPSNNEISFKILWIDSYDANYSWSNGQIEGFEEGLVSFTDNYEIRRIEMNTRFEIDEKNIENKVKEVSQEIELWKPDLLYLTDDNSQKYIGKKYLNSEIPIVFSGIEFPSDYGYDNAKNIGGAVNILSFDKGLDFLRLIFPEIKKGVVLTTNTPTGRGFVSSFSNQIKNYDELVVEYDFVENFEGYKRLVRESQNKDFLIFFPHLVFFEEEGGIVSEEEIQKWTIENSKIPDLTYFDTVGFETLLIYSKSPVSTGEIAGEIAGQILVKGKNPHSLYSKIPISGQQIINKARAEDLGINFSENILSSSKIINSYAWNK